MIIFVLICTVGINAVRNLAPWYEDAISMVTINTTLPWRRRLLPVRLWPLVVVWYRPNILVTC